MAAETAMLTGDWEVRSIFETKEPKPVDVGGFRLGVVKKPEPAVVEAFRVEASPLPVNRPSLWGTNRVTLRFFLELTVTSSALFLILESSGELPGMLAGEVLVELVELTRVGGAPLGLRACCCWCRALCCISIICL